MAFPITRSCGSEISNLILETSTTKTIKRSVLRLGCGWVQLGGAVSLLFVKNGVRLALEPFFFFLFSFPFFFFLRLSGTLINESLQLEVIYVLYTDFKTFANFVVSHDQFPRVTDNKEIRSGTFLRIAYFFRHNYQHIKREAKSYCLLQTESSSSPDFSPHYLSVWLPGTALREGIGLRRQCYWTID